MPWIHSGATAHGLWVIKFVDPCVLKFDYFVELISNYLPIVQNLQWNSDYIYQLIYVAIWLLKSPLSDAIMRWLLVYSFGVTVLIPKKWNSLVWLHGFFIDSMRVHNRWCDNKFPMLCIKCIHRLTSH